MRRMRLALLALFSALTAAVPGAQTAPVVQLAAAGGLQEPFAVDFDADGRMYIAEMAGNRVSVRGGDGRLFRVTASFSSPHHLLKGPDGFIYVADTGNHMVRRIDPASGEVTRVAGTGVKGFSGDGGPALDAQFGGIYAIAFHAGHLYVADLGNRRIRAVDLATGLVRTVAGNGEQGVPADGVMATSAPLVDPRAVAVDAKGNVYVCERGGHALRVVDPDGRIRTVAGTGTAGFSGDGGPARRAELRGPKHISVDADGSVLITDTENHVVRRYLPGDGRIVRVAGTGEQGAAGVGGPPDRVQLNRPHGALRHDGTLYISDSDNHRVLAIR
jgi:sugar lactone lactonase YvrE